MDDSPDMSGHWACIAEKIGQYGERERGRHTRAHTHRIRHRNTDIGRMGQATLERRGHTVLAPAGFLPRSLVIFLWVLWSILCHGLNCVPSGTFLVVQ